LSLLCRADKGREVNKLEQIRTYWEERGAAKSDGSLVTHRDADQVSMETELILSLINEKDTLLDIGCGNGYSTSLYSEKCKKVVGIDYARSMIEAATKHHCAENLRFERFDVLEMDERFGHFSVILTTRCLINFDTWERQQEVIERIYNCLSDKGRLILVEGSQQGRKNINDLRTRLGLPAMQPVWYNLDIDEDKLKPFVNKLFQVEKDIRFGLYDMLTRAYYPHSIKPKEPEYGTPFHKAARELLQSLPKDPVPQYSREFVLVLRKR